MSASTSLIRPVRATLARLRLPLTLARPIYRAASSAAASSDAGPSSATSTPSSQPPKSRGTKRPGTMMTGLAILKDQSDPVAMPDDQYPDWLWTILPDTTKSAGAKEKDEAQARIPGNMRTSAEFRQEKKRLRGVNRADIKGANYLKTT